MTDSELQLHLRRLSARQNNLERRLQRIENSSIFRFLRWIGPKLVRVGLPVPGVLPVDEAKAYQAWMRNSALSCVPKSSGTHADAILCAPPYALLEPGALDAFASAFDEKTAVVYSDWDHIDPGGLRHSPRFTPEYSPELLAQTPYFGGCYLVSSKLPRDIPWQDLPRDSVRRIPRILWHSQEQPAIPSNSPAPHPPSTARASIIICSRTPARLARCLKALRATLDPRHEIIVVAHDVDLQTTVKTVPYRGAFHFGHMNALGVQASSGDVLCFLNDDVFPSTPGWLESMLSQAVRPDVGIVGALLLYPDGSIQHAGVVVDRWHPAHVGRFQNDSSYWLWLRLTREVSAVTGACMAIRRSTWNELGGFDPQFPVNYNDIDLCLRAAASGYRILIETRAVLVHEEARTRVAVVHPEEAERFHERWVSVTGRPDPYFNPQLSAEDETITLPPPWS